jgi:hypothetical protein
LQHLLLEQNSPAPQQRLLQQSLPPQMFWQVVVFPLTHFQVPPPQLPELHPVPGVPPLMPPHPPQELQLGAHQLSFLSAEHSHEPQQPPFGDAGVQPWWSV